MKMVKAGYLRVLVIDGQFTCGPGKGIALFVAGVAPDILREEFFIGRKLADSLRFKYKNTLV